MVEYRLPKPWVTSSNLAIRSNDYMLLFSRRFFVYGSIRLFEVISLHFVTLVTAALLHLRVASLPPISYCMCRHPLHIDFSSLIQGVFFCDVGCEIRRYRKSTHLVGKCFAVFDLVFQIFYDFTQYPNFVFLIWERQINPFLVD